MLFEPDDFRLYPLGFAVSALLALAVVVLLLPKDSRRAFVGALAWGWVSGFGAGAILVALLYVPFVGYFLSVCLDKLLPYAWKIGIHRPPLEVVLAAFNVIGIVIGLFAGILAVLQPRCGRDRGAETSGGHRR